MCPPDLTQLTLSGSRIWSLTDQCLKELGEDGEHPFKAAKVTAEYNKTRSIESDEPCEMSETGLDETK